MAKLAGTSFNYKLIIQSHYEFIYHSLTAFLFVFLFWYSIRYKSWINSCLCCKLFQSSPSRKLGLFYLFNFNCMFWWF